MDQRPSTSQAAAVTPSGDRGVAGALLRFRVMAFVVGVGLLLLCAAMVLKYVVDSPTLVQVWGPIHGFLYMVYVLVTLDLGFRARWSLGRMILVALAGTVPFVSFWAEHRVVQWFRTPGTDSPAQST